MARVESIYAVYKGDKFCFDGTAKEIAKALGIKESSVRKMKTPSYQARGRNITTIVKLDFEEVIEDESEDKTHIQQS
ncbi:hypothetical protein [Otariodibacter oris]|uniref:Uncharacterized protein n=1 Tax=Otariodibacter oris TaxID=1032623 RepID=A0A420XIG2_9PAST|nr:hypothetical protein [Otariodibacter oris]QGM80693.1 hypothetical protein A6A10_04375 [Otariodibacter oris]RKR77145.1 hypothetical protein DES31_0470 [Otariodibacter oris]